MNYQVVAYTFLKTLYNCHVETNGAICSFDFKKFREQSGIDEPDGILELIISYLRGNGLIHMSLPINDEKKRTYHISLHGVACIHNFENSPTYETGYVFNERSLVHSGNSKQKERITHEHDFISEELCQTFFLRFI